MDTLEQKERNSPWLLDHSIRPPYKPCHAYLWSSLTWEDKVFKINNGLMVSVIKRSQILGPRTWQVHGPLHLSQHIKENLRPILPAPGSWHNLPLCTLSTWTCSFPLLWDQLFPLPALIADSGSFIWATTWLHLLAPRFQPPSQFFSLHAILVLGSPVDYGGKNSQVQPPALHKLPQKIQTFCLHITVEGEKSRSLWKDG